MLKEFSGEIREAIIQTTQTLKNNQFEEPSIEAISLVAHALKLNKLSLYLDYHKVLSNPEQENISELLTRRLNHEPLAYLTRHVNFMGFDFIIEPPVFIPRPETEVLVETLVNLAKSRGGSRTAPTIIFDIGTGCGIIGITSLKFLPNARVYAGDVIDLRLAQKNAIKLSDQSTCHSDSLICHSDFLTCHSEPFISCHSEGAKRPKNLAQGRLREESQYIVQGRLREESQLKISERIRFLRGNLLYPFNGKADFIVSNPPYIPSSEISSLQPEIKFFESHTAIDGGEDGLFFIRELIRTSVGKLKKSGALLLEISPQQANAVEKESFKYFKSVDFIKDFFGRTRILIAKYPSRTNL